MKKSASCEEQKLQLTIWTACNQAFSEFQHVRLCRRISDLLCRQLSGSKTFCTRQARSLLFCRCSIYSLLFLKSMEVRIVLTLEVFEALMRNFLYFSHFQEILVTTQIMSHLKGMCKCDLSEKCLINILTSSKRCYNRCITFVHVSWEKDVLENLDQFSFNRQ